MAKNVVIIGGGASGLMAAVQAARLGAAVIRRRDLECLSIAHAQPGCQVDHLLALGQVEVGRARRLKAR